MNTWRERERERAGERVKIIWGNVPCLLFHLSIAMGKQYDERCVGSINGHSICISEQDTSLFTWGSGSLGIRNAIHIALHLNIRPSYCPLFSLWNNNLFQSGRKK